MTRLILKPRLYMTYLLRWPSRLIEQKEIPAEKKPEEIGAS